MTHKDTSVHRGDDGVVYTNIISDNRDPMLDPVPCHNKKDCQVCLLKVIVTQLKKLVDTSVPYHTGPQTVSLLPGSAPGGQKAPPVSLEESERGEF